MEANRRNSRLHQTTSAAACRQSSAEWRSVKELLSHQAIGKRFSRLLITKVFRDGKYWRCLCLCDCGAEKMQRLSHVMSGLSRSCGCLCRERTSEATRTHGLSHTSEFKIWAGMIKRCENPNDTTFKHYGGRGIRVCDRWRHSFVNFYEDMGKRPPKFSIDRIDVNGNYEPGNCRWASQLQQAHNTRLNTLNPEIAAEIRRLAALGLQKIEISRKLGVLYSSVKQVCYGHQWRVS